MFPNFLKEFKIKSYSRIAILAVVFSCFVSACYDDTFDEFNRVGENYEYICFSVTDESAGVGSRSTDDICTYRNIYPLASEDHRDTLYLIESETEGINIVKNTQPESRGAAIETWTSLTNDLGIYAFASPEDGGVPTPATPLMFDHWRLQIMKNVAAGMVNTKLIDDEDNEQNDVKWPDYPLDFVAYYPHTASFKYTPATTKADPGDGTLEDTTIFDENDYKDDLYAWMWTPDRKGLCMHPTPRNNMYLYYKVPDSIRKQEDLMAA